MPAIYHFHSVLLTGRKGEAHQCQARPCLPSRYHTHSYIPAVPVIPACLTFSALFIHAYYWFLGERSGGMEEGDLLLLL